MDLDLFGVFTGKEVHLDNDLVKEINSKTVNKKRRVESSDIERITVKKTLLDTQVSSAEIQHQGSTSISQTSTVFSPPAKVYPFELDNFQKEAIGHIERDESVLVAAHTSAGKTAVAEYAIAKSLRDKLRVIYTSPIKALSNQKYRDLQEEFDDVGLMTGDMTINPNATCLIMTTEILRSMLYRGSEVIREVAWVIYDEVHYMRDKERGVVWEESIILLPHKVRFVFLSATIPNSQEFVDWVSKIHRQPCHVVYTEYRPVPLQHYVYPMGAEGLFLVVDEKSKFRDDNFQKAMAILQQSTPDEGTGNDKKKSKKSTGNMQADLFKIVRLIMDRGLDPCIIFSFSKKDCETFALQMSRLDFNNNEEKELVEHVFKNAIEALSSDDQMLPQVVTILPLLKRGIGVHHGGLLPILKEVIEILFQEGLIKCLFATETFSIGINMPARTVVFTRTRKFDGKDFRWITSGEYIQMSGRAGRRGKDVNGIVIQMLDEKMEPDVAKSMIYGASDPLHSSYHVSYNMLLNMLRVEDADPENVLKASFHQFQQERAAPEHNRKAEELMREASALVIDNEVELEDYVEKSKLLVQMENDLAVIVMIPEYTLPFLQPGRVVNISISKSNELSTLTWGIVVNFRKVEGVAKSSRTLVDYFVDVLIEADRSTEIIQVTLKDVRDFSTIRLNLARDLTNEKAREKAFKVFHEAKRRLGTFPVLDYVKDFGVHSTECVELVSRIKDMKEYLRHREPQSGMSESLKLYQVKSQLLNDAKSLREKAKESMTLSMKDTMRRMKRVLRRLQYVTDEGVLGPKGRFACEITTGDELVLTDLIFDGAFNDLTSEQIVGVLSCFVHKEPDEGAEAPPAFAAVVRQVQNTARNVCRASNDAKLVMDEEEYVKTFNVGLVEVAFAWSSGSKFADICRLTDVFEGSIIRTLRRLEELLRQLSSASAAIGNLDLKLKFEDGADKIRRGVVFCASLYT